MTWGVKKEELLALSRKQTCEAVSRQLPTADDALVSEDERWRLQWALYNHRQVLISELILKIMVVYGVTISHPSLRLAILALVDFSSPYEKQAENFVLRSITVGSQIPASDLDEADLVATSILAYSTFWLRRTRRGLRHELPSCSIHSKRFFELMRKLAPEGKRTISRYAFGRHWLALMALAFGSSNLSDDDPPDWEQVHFASEIFDLNDLATWTDAFAFNPNQLIASKAGINYHCRIILKSFILFLEHALDGSLPRNKLQKTILHNSALALSAIDSSPFHQQIICALDYSGINKFSNIWHVCPGFSCLPLWVTLRNFYSASLLAVLMLGSDNILKSAKLDEAAFHASRLMFEVSQYYDPRVAREWDISLWSIMFSVVASLVYPVSQVTQGFLFHSD